MLKFWPLELRDNNFSCLGHLSLWHFILAVQANQYECFPTFLRNKSRARKMSCNGLGFPRLRPALLRVPRINLSVYLLQFLTLSWEGLAQRRTTMAWRRRSGDTIQETIWGKNGSNRLPIMWKIVLRGY